MRGGEGSVGMQQELDVLASPFFWSLTLSLGLSLSLSETRPAPVLWL